MLVETVDLLGMISKGKWVVETMINKIRVNDSKYKQQKH
jgi:hypothetical protein